MANFTLMRGISGSGKSTYARELQQGTGAVVVSRDDLRLALYGVAFGPPINEDYITVVEFEAIQNALVRDIDVISDNTHLKHHAAYERLKFAYKLDAHLYLKEMEVSFAEALERNRKRGAEGGRFVPEHAISAQARAFTEHHLAIRDTYNRLTAGDTRHREKT